MILILQLRLIFFFCLSCIFVPGYGSTPRPWVSHLTTTPPANAFPTTPPSGGLTTPPFTNPTQIATHVQTTPYNTMPSHGTTIPQFTPANTYPTVMSHTTYPVTAIPSRQSTTVPKEGTTVPNMMQSTTRPNTLSLLSSTIRDTTPPPMLPTATFMQTRPPPQGTTIPRQTTTLPTQSTTLPTILPTQLSQPTTPPNFTQSTNLTNNTHTSTTSPPLIPSSVSTTMHPATPPSTPQEPRDQDILMRFRINADYTQLVGDRADEWVETNKRIVATNAGVNSFRIIDLRVSEGSIWFEFIIDAVRDKNIYNGYEPATEVAKDNLLATAQSNQLYMQEPPPGTGSFLVDASSVHWEFIDPTPSPDTPKITVKPEAISSTEDWKTPLNIALITIGCAVAVLVVIILVAFLICGCPGRSRHRLDEASFRRPTPERSSDGSKNSGRVEDPVLFGY